MSNLNLRAVARDIALTAEDVDYHSLAGTVMATLTPDQYGDALAQALPTFLREVAGSMRTPGAVHPPKPAASLPGSWKVQAIREGWQRRLSEIYATESGNKRLGDFDHTDLLHQAEMLQVQAKQKLAKAKGWRALADVVEVYGVARVRDLPVEVLMQTLGAVA